MKKNIIVSSISILLFVGFFVGIFILSNRNYNIKKSSKFKTNEYLAIYIYDDKVKDYTPGTSKNFPKEGYILNETKSVCSNGKVKQNEDKSINFISSSAGQCTLYFDKTLVQTLIDKANDESVTTYVADSEESKQMYTFSHEATEQTGTLTDYRYIGANPNNYVTFNDEIWRIVGVFPVDDGTGKIEYRVKIMRNETIEKPWDSNNKNDWVNSTLKEYLNGVYYDGLTTIAKKQIEDSKWYLGAFTRAGGYNGTDFYNVERSNAVAKTEGAVSVTPDPLKIGLLYPSDYAYTYANQVNARCFDEPSDCKSGDPTNGWMYNGPINKKYFWLLSSDIRDTNGIFHVRTDGDAWCRAFASSTATGGVSPVLYLKSNIIILDGVGAYENPYIISSI